jgi:hypothetical protein
MGIFEINLAIPTFAVAGTIIGPEGLAAVFARGNSCFLYDTVAGKGSQHSAACILLLAT